ncbi:hypothetical protein EYF80_067820 [Liparis tanakae]|uniref:Uncharacterized protein n=1 Tax=Liparis tanakae TaxID=230148 RepID=A0A4Z2E025_9TELE|nr:hypothetical protein EYF80_067820 [Liparis tanakae]
MRLSSWALWAFSSRDMSSLLLAIFSGVTYSSLKGASGAVRPARTILAMTAGTSMDFRYMIWSSIRDTRGLTTNVKPGQRRGRRTR